MARVDPFQSYWPLPGRLMAGQYPGSPARKKAERRLAWLLEQGVRNFVDLTEAGEVTGWSGRLLPYEDSLATASGRMNIQAAYRRFPIRDMDVPSPEGMEAILTHLDALVGSGEPAYVHCLGGRGRTGVVLGCYFVRHAPELLGCSDPQEAGLLALRKITEQRKAYGVPLPWDSPQTTAQLRMVRGWAIGQ